MLESTLSFASVVPHTEPRRSTLGAVSFMASVSSNTTGGKVKLRETW